MPLQWTMYLWNAEYSLSEMAINAHAVLYSDFIFCYQTGVKCAKTCINITPANIQSQKWMQISNYKLQRS